MSELLELHNEHSRRPNVFGESEMEHTIEILTGEITQVCVCVCAQDPHLHRESCSVGAQTGITNANFTDVIWLSLN